jgi:hypothetical protein
MEADFGLKFRKWIMANPQLSASFELKDTRGEHSLPFNAWEEEQINHALRNRSNKGNLIRIEKGTPGSPDYVYYRNSPSWVVIKYPKGFVIISPDAFIMERDKRKRKSLTWDRAKDIAFKVIHK